MTPSTSTPVKMSLPLSPQLETDDPLMEQVGYDNYFLILHCFLKLMSSYLWNILGYACFKRLGKFHVQMLSQMVIHHTSVMFGVAVRGWLVRDWKFFLLLCLVMQCLFSHRLLQILSSENHLLCCHRQILLAHYLLQKPCKLLSNRWHDTFADIQLCCTKLNNQFFSYFRHLISRLVSASLILLRRIPLWEML